MEKNSGQTKMGCSWWLMVFHMDLMVIYCDLIVIFYGIVHGIDGIMQVFFSHQICSCKTIDWAGCWRQAHESGRTSWDFSCHASISAGLCFLATGYCQGETFFEMCSISYSFLWWSGHCYVPASNSRLLDGCFRGNSCAERAEHGNFCWKTWRFPMDMGEKTLTLWWFSIATEHKL